MRHSKISHPMTDTGHLRQIDYSGVRCRCPLLPASDRWAANPQPVAQGLGRVKTKSNLVVALSGGGIFAFFSLSVTTSLKILGAVIPRGVFRRPGPGAHSRAASNQYLYSIISSARPLNGSGTVMPSALAVLRLMYSSTFAACWTGSSAGFSPLRIRPV